MHLRGEEIIPDFVILSSIATAIAKHNDRMNALTEYALKFKYCVEMKEKVTNPWKGELSAVDRDSNEIWSFLHSTRVNPTDVWMVPALLQLQDRTATENQTIAGEPFNEEKTITWSMLLRRVYREEKQSYILSRIMNGFVEKAAGEGITMQVNPQVNDYTPKKMQKKFRVLEHRPSVAKKLAAKYSVLSGILFKTPIKPDKAIGYSNPTHPHRRSMFFGARAAWNRQQSDAEPNENDDDEERMRKASICSDEDTVVVKPKEGIAHRLMTMFKKKPPTPAVNRQLEFAVVKAQPTSNAGGVNGNTNKPDITFAMPVVSSINHNVHVDDRLPRMPSVIELQWSWKGTSPIIPVLTDNRLSEEQAVKSRHNTMFMESTDNPLHKLKKVTTALLQPFGLNGGSSKDLDDPRESVIPLAPPAMSPKTRITRGATVFFQSLPAFGIISYPPPYAASSRLSNRMVDSEKYLSALFPNVVIDFLNPFGTVCTNPNCCKQLTVENIEYGWKPGDHHDYSTCCYRCGQVFVPQFTVFCTLNNSQWKGIEFDTGVNYNIIAASNPNESSDDLLWCQLLSPWVLLKEVQSVISQDGISALLSHQFVSSSTQHAVVFWNLIVTFKRFGLPYSFLLCNNSLCSLFNNMMSTSRMKTSLDSRPGMKSFKRRNSFSMESNDNESILENSTEKNIQSSKNNGLSDSFNNSFQYNLLDFD